MPTPFYLQGQPFYKLSMGYLGAPKSRPLLEMCRDKNWLVIDQKAGVKQGEKFANVPKGVFVYVCVGSWQLWGVYRITGDWKRLPLEMADLLPNTGVWGYREAELVAAPKRTDLKEIKDIRQFWAPSGNSSFFLLPELDEPNKKLFEPFFDLTIVPGKGENISISSPDSKPVFIRPHPMFPRNQILYGPPGTGKTYHTTARAVALLEGISDEALAMQYPSEKRVELRQKFEDYRAAGRIVFVTFHQAFTYEDFVEGIKPLPPIPTSDTVGDPNAGTGTNVVQYDVLPGIFRRICETAATAANTAIAPPMPAFSVLYDGFVAQLRHRMNETHGPLTFSSKTGEPMVLTGIPEDKPGRLTFLHGNSGQQDHHIDKNWIQKLYEQYQSIDQIHKLRQDITDVVGGSNATLMWVVFNELKKYEAQWLAQAREQERQKQNDTTTPPFVLIIDEINRGNVANIFGELITLLEDDKRAGRAEAVTVQLPYSKKPFTVPDNLYVLGTMNTADRSVEALDTALRRRFSFTEMLPLPELLPSDVDGINLQKLLRAVNARLEQLLDHDHAIGHALLMRVSTLGELREAFRRNILPLLQEYFFGDWGKIGLVLGGSFIQPVNKKKSAGNYKLLPFGSYHTGELSEKPVYQLTDMEQVTAEAFQGVYAS